MVSSTATTPNTSALFSSYWSRSYIRLEFLGHGVKVDSLSGSLIAVLAVFIISRIIKLLNGLRVGISLLGVISVDLVIRQ